MDPSSTDSFPVFRDGDVSIVISPTRIYQLHSTMLKRNSPYFEHELQSPGARLTSKARQEGLASYRFELVVQARNDTGYFEQKLVSDSGRILHSHTTSPTKTSDTHISEEKARYWDWLFGHFYGRQPAFCDTNLATVLTDCMGLVDVAESIGSVDRVREIVDLALLRQDSVLWQSIARNPAAWTELGRRVHSPTIFGEGVVHLVGLWPRIEDAAKSEMNDEVRNLVQRKFEQLELSKEALEMRILGHYPHFLTRKASDRPGRPSYANDIYMWQALAYFRHWFAQAISEEKTRKASDGGYAFYQALKEGGQGYLSHVDFEAFWRYFPMSGKACNVLEANMGVLKEDVKVFVSDITANRVHVKPEDLGMDWLTCAVIKKEDMPWRVREEVQPETVLAGVVGDEGEEGEMLSVPLVSRTKKQKKRLGASLGAATAGTDGDVQMMGEGDGHIDDEF